MYTHKKLASLLIRIVVGFIFFMHGFMKFQGGIANTVEAFEKIGLPGIMAYFIAAIELVGGISLILGYGSKFVALAFAVIMIGAITMVKWSKGLLGGYEFELTLFVMSIYVMLDDEPYLALDNRFEKEKEK